MMKFLRCGGNICMNNDDVENNCRREEEASGNVIEENTLRSSEERRSEEAKTHGWWLLPKRTYEEIKRKNPEYDWKREINNDSDTIKQQTPMENTVLHIAALYGNDECMERVVEIGPHLLRAKNSNGDTPLHVAARAGNISALRKLVIAVSRNSKFEQLKEALSETNNQGNNLFHEALLNGHKDVIDILNLSEGLKKFIMENLFVSRNNKKTSVVDLAFEKCYENIIDVVLSGIIPNPGRILTADLSMSNARMATCVENHGILSPPFVAILKQKPGILEKIVSKKKEWIHFKDDTGRNVLHYAASTENCPNPREIVDKKGRNIVHIAAIMGKFNVIRYILQDTNDGVIDMIKDKDYDGNTPLHLAASHCHSKIVQALTWDTRVDLHYLNNNNQTALDAFEQFKEEDNPPFPQRLTWCQLKSAGIQNAEIGSHSIEVPSSPCKPKSKDAEFYKDRINTLMLVSTLITTIAFAGGFTLPGGTNSSTPGQGMALMLNHVWFKPYILYTTISMYGGISVTIILIWAQLGDVTLALFALKVARPILGVTLATLSIAFLAGVHLVISDLNWLATTVLILCVIFILLLLLLYTLLWFPSKSSNLMMRYISFYPFQFLTWLLEKDSI
ncbi:transient receptor potential cation channel subfamily A member 1 [Vigna unguiculata]|uniref:Transient receptor potential cation channel subfamily A member 1 n=1 Tax=Vigna unguiculata TaxID=3917 RepID=A0A4D6M8J7_VIGUN|nr:transient receptor potential cation channel subfamily A member 1 [Vigna unguiculata]